MNEHKEYFRCDYCKGTAFSKVYAFNVSFREVNFTENLIYNENDIVKYECKQCGVLVTGETIRNTLKEVVRKYKEDYWENELSEDK
jgi:hypothetical protein